MAQRLSDRGSQQSAENRTNPGTNPVDILAKLPASGRPDVLARLLSARNVPEGMAGRIVGLLEGRS